MQNSNHDAKVSHHLQDKRRVRCVVIRTEFTRLHDFERFFPTVLPDNPYRSEKPVLPAEIYISDILSFGANVFVNTILF